MRALTQFLTKTTFIIGRLLSMDPLIPFGKVEPLGSKSILTKIIQINRLFFNSKLKFFTRTSIMMEKYALIVSFF